MTKNNKVAEAIFGSILPSVMTWLGEQKPDFEWLKKPLEENNRLAKMFCSGCGIRCELEHSTVEELFIECKSNKKVDEVNWDENFILVNACPYCASNAPVGAIAIVVAPKTE